ncbi:MAG: prepilin peptidase [Lachnospiraceae bacterium]|nr:prepilin peptidase [Lachnospiraceae bacterium]
MLPEIMLPFLFIIFGMVMGIPLKRYVMNKVCFSCRAPVLPVLGGGVYLLVFLNKGSCVETVIGCLFSSVLIALSIIDIYSCEIPIECNLFIGMLGVLNAVLNSSRVWKFLIGAIVVSGLLLAIYFFSGGKAIGGGDVKLMAAAGLLLGWKCILLAFIVGCVGVTMIHPLRMKFFGGKRQLAFGPYLAAGSFIAYLWGERIILLYLTWCGY